MTRGFAVAWTAWCALACTDGPATDPLPRVAPETVGLSSSRLEDVATLLRDEAAHGAFPGGVLLVGRRGAVVYTASVGIYGIDDPRPVDDSTLYDLASLTKVVGLTTATLLLVAERRLGLDDTVQAHVPEFAHRGVTVRHLLTHTSGMPAWAPLYEETPDADAALDYIYHVPLETPPGTQYRYSDLGAILLTDVVQRVTNTSLDRWLDRRVFRPLQMSHTLFRPEPARRSRIAPTERDPWRGRIVRGEVHDENAFHLGGVSGHAGLFSNALDLARFAFWLLDVYHARADPVLAVDAGTIRAFTTRQPGPDGSTRALGWDTPSLAGGGSAGHLLSHTSFGHTGFTGTSLWIDPVRDLVIVLLTNRVHPTRENRRLVALRGRVTDGVVRAVLE